MKFDFLLHLLEDIPFLQYRKHEMPIVISSRCHHGDMLIDQSQIPILEVKGKI